MAKVPVYVAFDYDHDARQKDLLIGQSRNSDSPFEVTDQSIKEASADWQVKARARIRRSQQVIVLCGKNTHSATGVSIEVKIAREEKKPYFLLAAYSGGGNTKPTAATSTDKIYNWTWDNLKSLLAGNR